MRSVIASSVASRVRTSASPLRAYAVVNPVTPIHSSTSEPAALATVITAACGPAIAGKGAPAGTSASPASPSSTASSSPVLPRSRPNAANATPTGASSSGTIGLRGPPLAAHASSSAPAVSPSERRSWPSRTTSRRNLTASYTKNPSSAAIPGPSSRSCSAGAPARTRQTRLTAATGATTHGRARRKSVPTARTCDERTAW